MDARTQVTTKAGRALLVVSAVLTTLVVSAGERALALPPLTLADPRGVPHRMDELTSGGRPVILIVTAPTLAAESDQRGWDEALPEASIGTI